MPRTNSRYNSQAPLLKTLEYKKLRVLSYEGALSNMPMDLFEDRKSILGLFLLKGGPVVLQSHKKRLNTEIINNRFLLISCPGKIDITFIPKRIDKPETIELFVVVFDHQFLSDLVPSGTLQRFDEFRGSSIRKATDILPSSPGLLSGNMRTQLFSFFFDQPKFKELEECFAVTKAMVLVNHLLEELFLFPGGRSSITIKEELIAQKTMEIINSKNNIHDITIAGVADQLNTNTTTLKQSFSKTFGTTISKAFMCKLMNQAQALIADGKKIGEVSEILGYSNISHFSKAYHNFFKMPPGRAKS